MPPVAIPAKIRAPYIAPTELAAVIMIHDKMNGTANPMIVHFLPIFSAKNLF